MPEKFDFSKIEDQKKFENLPSEEKEKIIDRAQTRASNEDYELKEKERMKVYDKKVQRILATLEADRDSIKKNREVKERLEETDIFLKTLPKSTFGRSPAIFSHNIRRNLESCIGAKNILLEKLKDKFVIDLGCGEYLSTGITVASIRHLKPKAYIGVDLDNLDNMLPDPADPYSYDKRMGIETAFINSDMLRFMATLPNNSVNYIISGIDNTIIRNEKYLERLNKEMIRTTMEKGIICGSNSEAKYFRGFKEITPPDALQYSGGFFILEKEGNNEKTA